MTTKKVCDKCKAPAVDAYALECEYCGGSSFSHVQTDNSKDDSSFRGGSSFSHVQTDNSKDDSSFHRISQESAKVPSDNYNPSIFEGLTDTTFEKYTTRKLASFTYQVALFVMGMIILACGALLFWAVFNQETTFPVLLGLLLAIAIIFLFALIWLASLRLRLESFTALVQIVRNTHKSE